MASMRVPRLILPLAAATLAGCAGGGGPPPPLPPADPPPAARAELAARAAAAQDLVGTGVYTLIPPGGAARTIRVIRAADGGWRVDIPGGALGGTVDVSIANTGGETYQCALGLPPVGPPPLGTGCVRADPLAPEVDPRVQHLFTDWLEVLTDRSAAVAITAGPVLPGVSGECYTVQPSAASLEAPLAAGVYCFETDGTLTGARLDLGELTLTGTDPVAPRSVELPAAVVRGQPLPTASPPRARPAGGRRGRRPGPCGPA
jgi:hypothetical protein